MVREAYAEGKIPPGLADLLQDLAGRTIDPVNQVLEGFSFKKLDETGRFHDQHLVFGRPVLAAAHGRCGCLAGLQP